MRPSGPASLPPEANEVLEELERILASRDFDASPRSRAFLHYVVEETLAGRQERLTQATIATTVFDRREDFDPTVDPIVRIQAGRLRRSLERYYLLSGSGSAHPVRIELQRGSYVPLLRFAGVEADASGRKTQPGVTDVGGWPSIVLSVRSGGEGEGGSHEATARFADYLAVELDRYRDVRVVVRRDLSGLALSICEGGSFALAGHLLEEGGHPRVSVHLLDCRTGRQVWAEEYRGNPGPSGDFYRETARVVAARVASEQGIVAQTLSSQPVPPDTEQKTYGAVLRSYRFFLTRERADLVPTLAALQRAVATDPECALAWAQLSRLHVANHAFEIAPADTTMEQGLAFAQNAVRLDPSSQRARAALAFALLVKDETAACRVEAESALSLNPETFVYLEMIGWLLSLVGDWDRGTELVRRAIAQNPHHMPNAYHALWANHLRRGEVEQAHQEALRYFDTGFFWRNIMQACCLGHLGRVEEARVEVAELLAKKPDFRARGRTLIGRLVKFPDLIESVVEGLGQAGLALDP